jgi:hypothetical protein
LLPAHRGTTGAHSWRLLAPSICSLELALPRSSGSVLPSSGLEKHRPRALSRLSVH